MYGGLSEQMSYYQKYTRKTSINKEIPVVNKRQGHISPVIAKSSERIGGHLSTWRRIEGITAHELAERAGVSVDTIRRLEHGDPSVGLGKVLAVARVVGILSQVEESFDPASTERGRLRLQESVPKRVRRS